MSERSTTCHCQPCDGGGISDVFYLYLQYYDIEGVCQSGLMAGGTGDKIDESQFTGLSKYFNSWTQRGRSNVAKATLGTIAAIYILRKIYKKLT